MKTPKHIKDLVGDPKNRRKHNPRNVGMVVDALHKVGAARSIVIDEDNVILAGNGVIDAAGEVGITKVQVVDVDGSTIVAVRRKGLTDQQKRELAIYDNRTAELADWNLEQIRADMAAGEDLSAFFHDDELAALLASEKVETVEGLTDPDAVPEQRATDIQAGDLFELGKHRLLCGDSTKAEDVARLMDGRKADVLFTDPPYAIYGSSTGVSGEIADDKMVRPFFRDILTAARAHTVPFAHIYVCCDFRSWAAWWEVAKDARVQIKNCIVWDKGNAAMGAMYRHRHEFVLFAVNAYVSTAQMSGKATGQRLIGNEENVWQVSRHPSGDKDHNAQKPVELVTRALSPSSDAGAHVLDLFGGSGTTLSACEQTDRIGLAMEMEPRFMQVIIDRWEAFTGQKAVKVGEAVSAA